jgi:hypothetical protein
MRMFLVHVTMAVAFFLSCGAASPLAANTPPTSTTPRNGNVFHNNWKPPLRPATPSRSTTPHEGARSPKASPQPPTGSKHSQSTPTPNAKPSSEPKYSSPAYKPDAMPSRDFQKSSASGASHAVAGETHAGTEHPGIAALRAKNRALQHDLPGKLEMERSRELMKQVYADKMRDQSIAARRLLAAELLDQAILADENAADQYVLLTGAIQAGRDGQDLAEVLNAVDAMALRYDVDALASKLELATDMTLLADVPANTAANVQSGLALIDHLAAAGNFDGALKLCAVLKAPAATDGSLTLLVQTRTTQIGVMKASAGATPPVSQ